MTILKNKERNITKDLPFAQKELGVDLKLNPDNDIEINNFQDFSLTTGIPNLAQATKIKLGTESKGNRYHPLIGINYPIGSKTVNAVGLRFDILRSLKQDPRYDNVEVSVSVDGNVYLVNARVSVLGTEVDVPLQFVSLD